MKFKLRRRRSRRQTQAPAQPVVTCAGCEEPVSAATAVLIRRSEDRTVPVEYWHPSCHRASDLHLVVDTGWIRQGDVREHVARELAAHAAPSVTPGESIPRQGAVGADPEPGEPYGYGLWREGTHRLKVTAPGHPNGATVELDGKELVELAGVEIKLEVDEAPRAELTFRGEVDVDLEAEVTVMPLPRALRPAAEDLSGILHGYLDERDIGPMSSRSLDDREVEVINALYTLDQALEVPSRAA